MNGFVKIRSTIIREHAVEGIACDDFHHTVYLTIRSPVPPYIGERYLTIYPNDSGYADAKALYDQWLAAATEGETSGE